MKQLAIETITQLLQSYNYSITQTDEAVLEAQKKRPLQIVVGNQFTTGDLEDALQKLHEVREEGAYAVIALPSMEAKAGSYDPTEFFEQYQDILTSQDINLWGVEVDTGRLYMPIGSMPSFDYKLMTKLMESKSMNLMAQKVKERVFKRQVLDKKEA